MRTLFSPRLFLLFLFATLIFTGCSKEEITPEPEQSSNELATFYEIIEGKNDLTKSTTATCAKEDVLLQSGEAGVYLNGGKYKTLNTYVYQGIDGITVSARYLIDNNLGLPARIKISLGDEEILFQDVIKGQLVSKKFSYPEGWMAGDEVSYQVDQTVYLSPVSFTGSTQLLPLCEINIGDNILGGKVAYIYQPGDEGYVEGETHGIILSPSDSFEGNWFDATEWANNLETYDINYTLYNDWLIPSIDELEILMTTFPQNFSYDPYAHYGYWSSTNYDPIEGWAYIGTLSGFFSISFASQPLDKSDSTVLTKAVRYF